MEIFTAQDAQLLTNFSKNYNQHLIAQYLKSIKGAASAGRNEYIQDAVGADVDMKKVTAALHSLGYQVHSLQGAKTPGGSAYVGQAFKVTW